MPVAVCTVLNSWWWTERPSETCRVSFQNKINLNTGASGWFYYRNNITMYSPMNVKFNRCWFGDPYKTREYNCALNVNFLKFHYTSGWKRLMLLLKLAPTCNFNVYTLTGVRNRVYSGSRNVLIDHSWDILILLLLKFFIPCIFA